VSILAALDVPDAKFLEILAQENDLLVQGTQVRTLDPVGPVQLPDDVR